MKMQLAAAHGSLVGTKLTCHAGPAISVVRGDPEVAGYWPKCRD
jgi:hypothetical protein